MTRIAGAALLALGLLAPTPAPAQVAVQTASIERNDYGKAESWLCRPGRSDACTADLTSTIVAADGKLTRESWAANPQAPIDCFYVYPTVSQDQTPRSDMIAGDDEPRVVRQQFARFASQCRPFAPLYRQVTLPGLRTLLNDPAAARGQDLALDGGQGYADVLDAWNYYLEHDNNGRGVVLIGHSQGSMILTTLIRNEIDGKPQQARLVSAMLLGSNVAVPRGQDVGGTFKSVPLCRRSQQTACVISYMTFRSNIPPPATTFFGRVQGSGMEAACTNPAALDGGTAQVHAYLEATGKLVTATQDHLWVSGALPVTTPFVSVPGLLSAKCTSNAIASYLEITVHANPADPRADDIPGDIGAQGKIAAEWGLHLIDVDVAQGNLVDIVEKQAKAHLAGQRARQRAAPAQRGTIPRTSSGKPDLNGIWQTLGNANYDIEPHAARPALAMRPGPVNPVPAKEVVALGAVGAVPSGLGIVVGGAIPYTPEARAKKLENQANWLARDPEIKCYLPGVPRATYMPFPFQIFQSERQFFIAYEYAGAVRHVYLQNLGPPEVDSWMGQSVGRWEGDTFVVNVTGFNDQSWFDRAGNHHTEALKVVERYTMLGPDHVQYEATMEDPRTFTRPWTIRMPLYRHVSPDARLGQFKCVEFVEELMYGHLRKTPIKP